MKAKNIQEYLGSLQQSVVTSWRKHLKSNSHAEHVILNDFYDDMLDAVDELTEAYMAHNGKVEGYENLFKDTKDMGAYDYVKMMHDFIDDNRDVVGKASELQSLVDDVLNVCDTAMYKLKELVHKGTNESLCEHLTSVFVNEAYKYMRYDIKVRHKGEDEKLLDISDNYSDHHLAMFLFDSGVVAALNSVEFSEIKPILNGLKVTGKMVAPKDVNIDVGNPYEDDHAMDCGAAGKRLFKKFEFFKNYKISTGDSPHGKDMKIHKV